MLNSTLDWVAWGLLALPLFIIAWAAVYHASIAAERNRHERYQRFFGIMQQLAKSDGATADKMAAAYELRRYRDYAPILAKVFIDGKVRNDTSDALEKQLKETLEFLK